jgi:hypothetical protein
MKSKLIKPTLKTKQILHHPSIIQIKIINPDKRMSRIQLKKVLLLIIQLKIVQIINLRIMPLLLIQIKAILIQKLIQQVKLTKQIHKIILRLNQLIKGLLNYLDQYLSAQLNKIVTNLY